MSEDIYDQVDRLKTEIEELDGECARLRRLYADHVTWGVSMRIRFADQRRQNGLLRGMLQADALEEFETSEAEIREELDR